MTLLPVFGPGFDSTPPIIKRASIKPDAIMVNVIISTKMVLPLVLFLVTLEALFTFCLLYEPMLDLQASMEIIFLNENEKNKSTENNIA